MLGRLSSSKQPLAEQGCAQGAVPLADSVAPEGPVSSSFEATHDYRGRPRTVTSADGVVAADHGRCSDIGAEMLRRGGNAVDAAVAAALCQGVYNPQASGVGGGHIMLIRRAVRIYNLCFGSDVVNPAAHSGVPPPLPAGLPTAPPR